jgi:hypothetical protein
VAVARLKHNPVPALISPAEKLKFQTRFAKFFHATNGTRYNSNLVDLFAAACACLRGCRDVMDDFESDDSCVVSLSLFLSVFVCVCVCMCVCVCVCEYALLLFFFPTPTMVDRVPCFLDDRNPQFVLLGHGCQVVQAAWVDSAHR